MGRPVILCPLAVERRAIAKRLRDRADIRLIGPGPAAVGGAMESVVRERPPLVVLFGVAGGLAESEPAPRIARVVDKDARAWLAPVVPPGESATVTIVGMDEPVLHAARKKQMASAYAAALVDTESHAFARLATEAGLRWAIVRGVSDGPDADLAAAAADWVDEEGRTRIGRVLLACALNPAVLWSAITLARRARPALRAAASRLIEVLNADASGAATTTASVLEPESRRNPIERQLGRRSARLNDPPPATPRGR